MKYLNKIFINLLQTINIKENKPATYMTPSQDR